MCCLGCWPRCCYGALAGGVGHPLQHWLWEELSHLPESTEPFSAQPKTLPRRTCRSSSEPELPAPGVCVLVAQEARVMPFPHTHCPGLPPRPGASCGPARPMWLAGFRASSVGTRQAVTSLSGGPQWRGLLSCVAWWGHAECPATPARPAHPLASCSRTRRRRKPVHPLPMSTGTSGPTCCTWRLVGRHLHSWWWGRACPLSPRSMAQHSWGLARGHHAHPSYPASTWRGHPSGRWRPSVRCARL